MNLLPLSPEARGASVCKYKSKRNLSNVVLLSVNLDCAK